MSNTMSIYLRLYFFSLFFSCWFCFVLFVLDFFLDSLLHTLIWMHRVCCSGTARAKVIRRVHRMAHITDRYSPPNWSSWCHTSQSHACSLTCMHNTPDGPVIRLDLIFKFRISFEYQSELGTFVRFVFRSRWNFNTFFWAMTTKTNWYSIKFGWDFQALQLRTSLAMCIHRERERESFMRWKSPRGSVVAPQHSVQCTTNHSLIANLPLSPVSANEDNVNVCNWFYFISFWIVCACMRHVRPTLTITFVSCVPEQQH